MSLYLNSNLTALTSMRAAQSATNAQDLSYQRLATGLRINSAKDDPAGMQTSDKLTVQINSLDQTNRIAQNGISYAQTAEGAMDEIANMLQRIRTLSVQAATGTNTDPDRQAIQEEVDQLNEEICRIAKDTCFGSQHILDGTASMARFQIGPEPNSIIKIDLRPGFDTDNLSRLAASFYGDFSAEVPPTMTVAQFDFTSVFHFDVNGGGIDISTQSSAELVLAGIDRLISALDRKRAELGAVQNRLESTIRNQDNISENVSASRMRIRDTDWATEASNLAASQVLQQGSVSILTQANTRPQIALQMLQT